jgi:hypothetical protein
MLAAVTPVALTGCREEDAIQKETFTFPDREKIYKRVAICKREDQAWFFLISGPEAEVLKQVPTFDAFVRSAKIDAKIDPEKKEPPVSWDEPKTWRKDPPTGSELRYAGFRIPAEPKELEVAVTHMAVKGFSLLSNINRWLKQVNVPQVESLDELNPKYVKVTEDQVGDQRVIWVDVKGLAIHSVSKVPDAMALKKKVMPKFQLQEGPAERNPFKYQVPEGWRQQPIKGIAVDYYRVEQNGQSAEVTLTPASGTLEGNIKRWRDQIDLPFLAGAEATKAAEKVTVAGIPSYYVDLANPNGPRTFNRILAVIVPMGNTSWFIKMWGPNDVIGQNKNAFETFFKSFEKVQ